MSLNWVRSQLSLRTVQLYFSRPTGQPNLPAHARCSCALFHHVISSTSPVKHGTLGTGSGQGVRLKQYSKREINILSPTLKQGQMEVKKFRQDAVAIFDSAVESVYPPKMIGNAISLTDDGTAFTVQGRQYKLNNNVYVVGFGKAVLGMARAMEDILGKHLIKGVISIPHGSQELFTSIGKVDLCVKDTAKIQVFEGARDNLPDNDAHTAAMAIQKLASNLGQNHILFVLISGGGSALLPSPMAPITLQEEQEVTRQLSLGGATIQQLNIVRQNLETLKGGGLAQVASPASVISLILSDVVGDKLDLISSGPTVPLLSSPRQSLQVLEMLNLMDSVPSSVTSLLQQRASEKKNQQICSPQQHQNTRAWDHVQNAVIGSNTVATETALQKAIDLDYVSMVLTNSLQGDCRHAAAMFMEIVKFVIHGYGDIPPDQGHRDLTLTEMELTKLGMSKSVMKEIVQLTSQAYNSRKGLCLICGGETTVDVRGSGKGGRNQEMALAFAMLYNDWLINDKTKYLDKFHVEFLSAGTDGQDGPTDAAGAVVNKNVIPMAITSKLRAADFLNNNDSYTFFNSLVNSECLIKSGLTGTNVMDLQLLIIKYL